jgi:hypothetical protein
MIPFWLRERRKGKQSAGLPGEKERKNLASQGAFSVARRGVRG